MWHLYSLPYFWYNQRLQSVPPPRATSRNYSQFLQGRDHIVNLIYIPCHDHLAQSMCSINVFWICGLGSPIPCSLFLASLFSSIPLSDVTFFFFTSPSLRQDLGLMHLFNYGNNNNNSLVFKAIIIYWALC